MSDDSILSSGNAEEGGYRNSSGSRRREVIGMAAEPVGRRLLERQWNADEGGGVIGTQLYRTDDRSRDRSRKLLVCSQAGLGIEHVTSDHAVADHAVEAPSWPGSRSGDDD